MRFQHFASDLDSDPKLNSQDDFSSGLEFAPDVPRARLQSGAGGDLDCAVQLGDPPPPA